MAIGIGGVVFVGVGLDGVPRLGRRRARRRRIPVTEPSEQFITGPRFERLVPSVITQIVQRDVPERIPIEIGSANKVLGIGANKRARTFDVSGIYPGLVIAPVIRRCAELSSGIVVGIQYRGQGKLLFIV